MAISPIRDSEGGIESFIAIKRDVTERKRAEEKIALQQAQPIQADKMASLGTLVAGVAHEINNPNAIITLNTPSLRAFWEDVLPILDAHQASNGDFFLASIPYDRVRKDLPAMLEDIQGGAERIKTIVENLKDFARQGVDGERSTISLNKVVKSAVVLVGAKIRKTTTRFHLALAEDLPMVEANFQEMEQVVINLLTNSCDALADMGKAITISTKYNAKAQQALIVVADEGEGISQENLSRIKEPFFTTKRDTGGTGLGLSVSHGIIDNHNGVLEFSSPPEGGAIATISLSVQIN